jgi:hypothetical protein
MSPIRRRAWMAGLTLGLGLGSTAPSEAQGLPSPSPSPVDLPPLPASPAMAPAPPPGYPLVRPAPSVVEVPPGGNLPAWRPGPIDPIALEKLDRPGHPERKARSWTWRRFQGRIFGYPEEYEPRPLGAAMYEAGKIMTANAAEVGLVLHRYDFVEGTSELSARGGDQLAKLAAQLAVSPFPLIVERTPEEPGLAESRRFAVLARLARGPMPVTSDRVLVGVPRAHGLSGSDAQVIAGNALGRVQQYGPPIPINSNGVNSPSGVTSSGSGSVGP